MKKILLLLLLPFLGSWQNYEIVDLIEAHHGFLNKDPEITISYQLYKCKEGMIVKVRIYDEVMAYEVERYTVGEPSIIEVCYPVSLEIIVTEKSITFIDWKGNPPYYPNVYNFIGYASMGNKG